MSKHSIFIKDFFMRHHKTHLAILLSLAVMASAAFAGGGNVIFQAPEVYPEGVAFDSKSKEFLVSSMHYGTIGRVTLDGKYKQFINDDHVVCAVGMTVDEKRNRLWVAISDLGVSTKSKPDMKRKLAAVAAFNLKTGERIAYHDLGKLIEGEHFANDLTVGPKGDLYVTDSFSPVIYHVDTAGKASIFAQSDMFKGEGFNLNGIVYHPGGFLLVAKYNSGELFKVDIKDPKQIQKVNIPENFSGADGLVLNAPNQLIIVQNNGADAVVQLESSDNWSSAKVKSKAKTALPFPTTATKVGKSTYVLNAKLGELFDPKAPKSKEYLLQPFDF
jgi:sugar lactone lactonase YvrE